MDKRIFGRTDSRMDMERLKKIEKKRHLICVGAAPCADEDIKAVNGMKGICPDYLAIGLDSAEKWVGRYKYFVSYEPFDLPKFIDRRKSKGLNIDFLTFSQEQFDGIDYIFPELTDDNPDKLGYSGSSALLAVKIGLRLGYRKIILVGVQLNEGRYIKFQRGWTFVQDMICDTVRSQNGFVKELLGSPTEEWLNGQ